MRCSLHFIVWIFRIILFIRPIIFRICNIRKTFSIYYLIFYMNNYELINFFRKCRWRIWSNNTLNYQCNRTTNIVPRTSYIVLARCRNNNSDCPELVYNTSFRTIWFLIIIFLDITCTSGSGSYTGNLYTNTTIETYI